jgi:hypothetical protein
LVLADAMIAIYYPGLYYSRPMSLKDWLPLVVGDDANSDEGGSLPQTGPSTNEQYDPGRYFSYPYSPGGFDLGPSRFNPPPDSDGADPPVGREGQPDFRGWDDVTDDTGDPGPDSDRPTDDTDTGDAGDVVDTDLDENFPRPRDDTSDEEDPGEDTDETGDTIDTGPYEDMCEFMCDLGFNPIVCSCPGGSDTLDTGDSGAHLNSGGGLF